MPWVSPSSYRAPVWLRGGDLQTIWPALTQRVRLVTEEEEVLELNDGDFLNLAWGEAGTNGRVAVLCHGLEGSLHAPYIQGMAAALQKRGWGVLAWSYRGCGQKQNRLASFYHSGQTEDLESVIEHVAKMQPGATIDLVGFSLGGNLVLKFLGEQGSGISKVIGRAVALSAPCDLASCALLLGKKRNFVYQKRFLGSLVRKIRRKHVDFPDDIELDRLSGLKSLAEFDERFTAPLHGFQSAQNYWESSSSRQWLGEIRTDVLLINAENDPILGAGCYPVEEAKESECFHLETPAEGGHVGFCEGRGYWSERRVVEFLGRGLCSEGS